MTSIFKRRSFEEILGETPLSDLVPPTQQRPITLTSSATISQTLKVLSENKILSIPIEDSDQPNKFLGFVDYFDILTYILNQYMIDKEVDDSKIHLLHQWCQNIHTLEVRGIQLGKVEVKTLINKSQHNPFLTLSQKDTVSSLLKVFRQGIHRIGITNSAGQLVNILSQSNLIQWVARHAHYCDPKLLSTTVEELGLGKKSRVVTVHFMSKTIHAYFKMTTEKVSAVPIVNDQGIMLANLSLSDLRGLTQSNFVDLLLPVGEYFAKNVTPLAIPPLSAKPKTTIETVIFKLAATRVHRLWVVDEYGRPTGVISLTDVSELLDLRVYTAQEDKTTI